MTQAKRSRGRNAAEKSGVLDDLAKIAEWYGRSATESERALKAIRRLSRNALSAGTSVKKVEALVSSACARGERMAAVSLPVEKTHPQTKPGLNQAEVGKSRRAAGSAGSSRPDSNSQLPLREKNVGDELDQVLARMREGMTMPEVAKTTGFHIETLRKWARAGELKTYKVANVVRVHRSDLKDFLDRRMTGKGMRRRRSVRT